MSDASNADRERAFMREVARWRPRGDGWFFIAYALNHGSSIPAPDGEARWLSAMVREEFERLLPEGMSERAWCLNQLAAQGHER